MRLCPTRKPKKRENEWVGTHSKGQKKLNRVGLHPLKFTKNTQASGPTPTRKQKNLKTSGPTHLYPYTPTRPHIQALPTFTRHTYTPTSTPRPPLAPSASPQKNQ